MDAEGRQVYVAAGDGSAILTFQRDTTTGTLTPGSVIHNGQGGVSGLTNLLALEMSPDGRFLYAAADELVVFTRDSGTGDLGFIEAVSRAGPGNSCASDVLAISTDGRHVYLGAEIFQRDAISGTLTASGLADDSGASDGYKFYPICATAVSRDGYHYYEARRFFVLSAGTGSSTVESLGVYQRDPATGTLSFLEHLRIGGSASLVVSPGEGYVYTAGTPLRTSFTFPDPEVSVLSRVTPPPSNLAAAVLPGSRSVPVGGLATAFASIINQGTEVAHRCTMALETAVPADFDFHATDPLTNLAVGLQNTPFDILPGAAGTLVFAVSPSASIQPQALLLRFSCADRRPVAVLNGINTFFLAAATEASADVIAIASTIDNDGIVKVPGLNAQGIFAVATANVGVGGMITASADHGGASLPVEVSVCEADPATAICLPASSPGNPIMTQIDANETNTFVVFVHSSDAVGFNPETNRIFIRFKDEGGTLRGVTSVAVTTGL